MTVRVGILNINSRWECNHWLQWQLLYFVCTYLNLSTISYLTISFIIKLLSSIHFGHFIPELSYGYVLLFIFSWKYSSYSNKFKRSFELYAQVFENIVHIKNIRVIYERKRYKIKENWSCFVKTRLAWSWRQRYSHLRTCISDCLRTFLTLLKLMIMFTMMNGIIQILFILFVKTYLVPVQKKL